MIPILLKNIDINNDFRHIRCRKLNLSFNIHLREVVLRHISGRNALRLFPFEMRHPYNSAVINIPIDLFIYNGGANLKNMTSGTKNVRGLDLKFFVTIYHTDSTNISTKPNSIFHNIKMTEDFVPNMELSIILF